MTNSIAQPHETATNRNVVKLFQVGDKVVNAHEILPLLERYQLLPQLIREIILDQAISNLSCSESEQQAAVERFFQHYNLTTQEQQQTWLQSQNLTPEKLKERVGRSVLLDKFKITTWNSKVESYFMSRKASLDQVMYSLLRVKDIGIAQELYFRIKEGEKSFSDLAREYSQGLEAHTNGLVGPMPLSKPHPVIAKLLAVSQPGQMRPPTRLEDWFVIVRLEKYMPAQLDESMRRHLIDELFETWLGQQLRQVGPLRPLDASPSA